MKIIALACAIALGLALSACTADQASLAGAGLNVASKLEAPVCAALNKTAAKARLCMSASGVAIRVAEAIAAGEIR